MAFVLGLGLMITMMSFKGRTTDVTYGYDYSNPSAPWVQLGTEGYACRPVINEPCTYTFDELTPPVNSPTPTPRSSGTPVELSIGSYQFIEP